LSNDPKDGHTFRFIFDIKGAFKKVDTNEYVDESEFAEVYFTFDVRAWSLKEALLKAAELPFSQQMNEFTGEVKYERAEPS
jgi:hypothetical protein